ncbi:MAG: rRNA pseudouridine synthase [Clostridia bacterium]|nr:rRNA pseudouridine synthase [Clostridia bacterium]
MRINKYIAECGIASRRNADKLILEGRVRLNNKPVTECGVDVNEYNDTVTVDGEKISLPSQYTYIVFNKPKGCICSSSDEKGRKTVFDYVDIGKRLFTVGRLDFDSEGLLLLTNDGEFANRLTHPSNEIPKTYLVKIEGEIAESELATLRKGVVLDDGTKTGKAKVKLIRVEGNLTRLEVTIHEGKNREIRRMFEAVGKNVVFLKRISICEFKLGGLSRGEWRYLKDNEIYYLNNI